jgi:4-diphosphocytidyl-2-C-methyl-D-erythritol kinase
MENLTLPAPGKLNLFLHITAQREDGHHELQTIFQLIDYGDSLTFTPRDDKEILVNAKIPGLAAKNNLVMRAAKLIQQHDKKRRGIEITLRKRLPIGGGLGGGSSDAATTLHALNTLWELDISTEHLMHLGKQLGADVPVFIKGRSCWAEGIGEIITPLTLPDSWFLVIIPPVSVSTTEIFFDKQLTRDTAKQTMSTSLIETGVNDCQAVVVKRFPVVAKALDWLNQFGTAQMTGTGACIFAPFATKAAAEKVLTELPKDLKGFVARGLNTSPLLTALEANR